MKIAALDIETLSLDKNSAIVSDIGIIIFDDVSEKEEVIGLRPNIIEQLLLGRTCSKETIDFHTAIFGSTKNFEHHIQNSSAYENVTIAESHKRISEKLSDVNYIWINGLSFDPTVLESLYKLVNKKLPWGYRKEIDVRTINNLVNPSMTSIIDNKSDTGFFFGKPKNIATHDAIADARWNLVVATEFYKNIKKIRDYYEFGTVPTVNLINQLTNTVK